MVVIIRAAPQRLRGPPLRILATTMLGSPGGFGGDSAGRRVSTRSFARTLRNGLRAGDIG